MLNNTLKISTGLSFIAATGCLLCANPAQACNYATVLAQKGVLNPLNVAARSSTPEISVTANAPAVPADWAGPENAGIVGFWNELTYYQGTLVDQRYDNWFADHNELWVDLSPPATNDVCNGVWKQVGPQTYKLRHMGFNFDATSGVLLNTWVFDEIVVLSKDGDSFTATETEYEYDTTGTVLLGTFTGITSTATRFKVNF